MMLSKAGITQHSTTWRFDLSVLSSVCRYSNNQTSSEDEEQGGSRPPTGDQDQEDGQSASDDKEHSSPDTDSCEA